jgi:fatty acid desaturase
MMNKTEISTSSRSEHEIARRAVSDLFQPKPVIFWCDLLFSAMVGWSAFVFAYLSPLYSWQAIGLISISTLTLYRSLSFTHEISHLQTGKLPGFRQVWDILIGFPLLLPSCIYDDVHADHHRLARYGTNQDPEYLSLSGQKLKIALKVASTVLIPIALAMRFLVLAPIGLLLPPLHQFLEVHASSLALNLSYQRRITSKEHQKIVSAEVNILAMWALFFGLLWLGILTWKVLLLWYIVASNIALINELRTLGAHRYHSHDQSMNLTAQLLDSVNVPGAAWTVLWAPVGLRYHALHHYFPSIPYHNLAIAHQRLMQQLPENAAYLRATSPSLWQTLQTLWQH